MRPESFLIKRVKAEVDAVNAKLCHRIEILVRFHPVCCNVQITQPFYGAESLQKWQTAFAGKGFAAGDPYLFHTQPTKNGGKTLQFLKERISSCGTKGTPSSGRQYRQRRLQRSVIDRRR